MDARRVQSHPKEARSLPGCHRLRSRFPNGLHVFLIRRNKVRLAVSWWKAIQSRERHREHGARPAGLDVADRDDFAAIDTLLNESVLREAAVGEFLAEAGVIPLTVAYEDLVRDHAGTIRAVLRFLGAPEDGAEIRPPHFGRLADEVPEEWGQRFRREKQGGWKHVGW